MANFCSNCGAKLNDEGRCECCGNAHEENKNSFISTADIGGKIGNLLAGVKQFKFKGRGLQFVRKIKNYDYASEFERIKESGIKGFISSHKKLCIALIAVIVIAGFLFGDSGMSNRELQKILKNSAVTNMDISSANVIYTEEQTNQQTLVLFDHKNSSGEKICSMMLLDANDTITSFNNDISVVYQKNGSTPKYFVLPQTSLEYAWGGIMDENTYKVWEASTDRQTQQIVSASYGPPYQQKTLWYAYDAKTFERVGKYLDKETALTKLKAK